MTIEQGIAHNQLKSLRAKRLALVMRFNSAALKCRDVSGMYIPGRHSGADYLLAEILKVDEQISKLQK